MSLKRRGKVAAEMSKVSARPQAGRALARIPRRRRDRQAAGGNGGGSRGSESALTRPG